MFDCHPNRMWTTICDSWMWKTRTPLARFMTGDFNQVTMGVCCSTCHVGRTKYTKYKGSFKGFKGAMTKKMKKQTLPVDFSVSSGGGVWHTRYFCMARGGSMSLKLGKNRALVLPLWWWKYSLGKHLVFLYHIAYNQLWLTATCSGCLRHLPHQRPNIQKIFKVKVGTASKPQTVIPQYPRFMVSLWKG